ncbi:MAG: glycosyltransferase involved in cell wall biosynthesis [Loktanella salsilacus]|jgi:glycosyltransferase involved in cell wall biosynthesis
MDALSSQAAGRPFFILDPDLRSGFSHNLTATTRVTLAATAAGYDVTCIVNRKFPFSNTDLETVCPDVRRIWPTYALNASDDPQPEGPLQFHPVYDSDLPGWEKYLYGLLDLHATLTAPQDAVFYIHTLSAPGVMALLQYLLSIPPHQRPRIHALIYCTPEIIQGEGLQGVETLQVLERLRDEGLLGQDLLIHVETAGLKSHYAALGFDFPICMGPLTILAPDTAAQAAPTPVQGTAPKRVVFVGEARAEKGFDRLPKIVAAIQAAYPGNLEFVLQSYTNASNDSPAITDAKMQLAQMDGRPHPIALPGELDYDAFLATIDAADLILMPYDADAYRTRGSGVVYDAISRRVPVVCTPGTDMIGTFAGMGVFSPDMDTTEGFGDTVAAVLSGETPFPDTAIARFGIDRFISTLTTLHSPGPCPAAPDTPAPLVCYIPALPVDGGHGFVQRAHLAMLSHMAADTMIVGVPWANIIDGLAYFKGDTVVRYFDDQLWRGKPLYFVSLNDTENFRRLFNRYHRHDAELFHVDAFEELIRDYVTIGPVLQAYLNLRTPDRIVANYTWARPLAQRLHDLTGAPTICEVHDFQTQQNVFRRQSRAESATLLLTKNPDAPAVTETVFDRGFAAEAASEASALHSFDRRVFISRTLQEDLARHGGPDGDVIYPPNVALPAERDFDMDRADLLDGDHLQQLDLAQLTPGHGAQGQSHSIDIVFVGTAHAANIASLRFFLDDVLPLLPQKQKINIFIVGNINQGFQPDEKAALAARNVFFMGRVTSVTDWYLASKIVLLPVIEGTGFPTKVIEALSLGQCFSAMSGSFYELAAQIGGTFPAAHTAAQMANDIVLLLSDPAARTARGKAGQAFYDRIFGIGDYLARWSDVLALPVAKTTLQPPLPHVECPDAVDRLLRLAAIPLDDAAMFMGQRLTGLAGDWSNPEPEARWIDGTTAHLFLRAPNGPREVTGVFIALRIRHSRGPVTVLANGVPQGSFVAGPQTQVHYLPFAKPLTVCDVMTLTLITPHTAPDGGEDTRSLSALVSYMRVEARDAPSDDDMPLYDIPVTVNATGRLHWWSEHQSEGPYPEQGLPNRFRWIGAGGMHVDYTDGANPDLLQTDPVFLQIDGFTQMQHQSLVVTLGEQVITRLPLAGNSHGRTPFTRIIPLHEGTVTLRPSRTQRFAPPDGRSAGFAVTGLRVFTATGHGDRIAQNYIGNLVIRSDA